MGILNKLFNSGELVKEVGNTIDKLTTSDQERLQAKKEIKEALLDYENCYLYSLFWWKII